MRIATTCPCCNSADLRSSPAILMPFIAHRVFDWQPTHIDESWGLKTIKPGQAYSLCNSMECNACGLVFLDMRFSDEEMGRLYNNYRGEDYTHLREQYEPGYAARNVGLDTGCDYISDIEHFLKPLMPENIFVLDWGGDTGKNTPFRGKVSQVDIYDISNKPVTDGARRVTREQALENAYSLIICSNVLEHVSEPINLIEEIKKFMRPETILYLEIPFEELMKSDQKNRVSFKKHWHEHINFFSQNSLEVALKKAGLCIETQRVLEVVVAEKKCSVFQIAAKLSR